MFSGFLSLRNNNIMKAFYSTAENMKFQKEQQSKFYSLCKKYPCKDGANVGIAMSLGMSLSPRRSSTNIPCLTPDDVESFVQDMIENNWFFNSKLTKSKTERGMTRFLNSQFSNTKLKSF